MYIILCSFSLTEEKKTISQNVLNEIREKDWKCLKQCGERRKYRYEFC